MRKYVYGNRGDTKKFIGREGIEDLDREKYDMI